MIVFACTFCETKLRMPDEAGGKKVRCPRCKSIQTVPVPQPQPVEKGIYDLADDPDEPTVKIVEEQPRDELTMLTSAKSQPRYSRSPAKVRIKESGETNKAYGGASLMMTAVVIVTFFTPWLKIWIFELSPMKFVQLIANSEQSSTAGPSRPNMDSAIILSMVFYGIGVILATIGGIRVLSNWKSAFSIFGFVATLLGCVIFAGIWFSRSPDMEKAMKAINALGDFGLTPWFYIAIIASIVGLIVSALSMKRIAS